MVSFLGWFMVVCASAASGFAITVYVLRREQYLKHITLMRDPGPLTDRQLIEVLRNYSYAPASPTHDRVQDAVMRIMRERDGMTNTRV